MSRVKRSDEPFLAQVNREVPEGWASATLGDLVRPSPEKVEPQDAPKSSYLSLEHVESGTHRILGSGVGSDVGSTKAIFRRGDVLYGKLRPYLNKVCIPDFDGICSTDFLVFRPSPALDQRLLLHFLSQPEVVEYANHHSSGVQLPRVNFEKLAELEVPVPPLAEQRRIVAHIEVLLERANSARAVLARVPAILKRFRQAVLAAACQGSLTENWRLSNPTADADSLVLPLLRVRQPGLVGQARPHETWPPIPDTWKWLPIESLLRDSRSLSYGILKPGEHDPDGVPMVRVMDIGDAEMKSTTLMKVSPALAAEYRRTRLEQGDILLAVMATIGRSVVVPPDLEGANVNRALAVLKLSRLLNPHFICMVIRSPFFQEVFASEKLGSAQARINLGDLRMFAVPIPPAEEQAEIVQRVEALFKLSDVIEKRVAAAMAHAEKVTHAIIAKAFRGDLVPTEGELARRDGRDFETAADLLERAGEQRAVAARAGRPRASRPRVR